jgi:hypothetical protein
MAKSVQKISLSASRDIPFDKLVLSQSNVRHVKAGVLDVERTFPHLPDRRDAGQRQEQAKMVREVSIGAGNRAIVRGQVFRLKKIAVRRQHKARLRPSRRWARFQRRKRPRDLAGLACGNMDVVGLQDAAQIGLVGLALTQSLERGLLVSERLQERVRELFGLKRALRQRRDGFFDLYCIQSLTLPSLFIESATAFERPLRITQHDQRRRNPNLRLQLLFRSMYAL